MTHLIRTSVGLLFAYVIAAPLTSRISMDLSQTAWGDLWTYVFWVFGLFIWVGLLLGMAGVIAFIVAFLDR